MAYLNLRDEKSDLNRVTVELGEHSRLKWKASFTIPKESRLKIQGVFQELLKTSPDSGHSEIRMDLPTGWTLFWKLREDTDSRLLLAHPEKEEWVATFALNKDHFMSVLDRFEKSESFLLSSLGIVSKLSNVEFEAKFT